MRRYDLSTTGRFVERKLCFACCDAGNSDGSGVVRALLTELLFESLDAGLETLVFLPRGNYHFAQNVHFLAGCDVHIPHKALELGADHGLDLPTDPLRRPGGVRSQTGEFVEDPVGRLGHGGIQGMMKAVFITHGHICPKLQQG